MSYDFSLLLSSLCPVLGKWFLTISDLLYHRLVFMVHCCLNDQNDLWLLNDHFRMLHSRSCVSSFLTKIEVKKLFNNNFLLLLLDRFASHRQHTIFCQPATTTSWCWPTFRETWRCLCHPSLSPNTPIKSSQAAGIQQISHSCQHPPTKLQSCGRCLPFRPLVDHNNLFLSMKNLSFC